MTSCVFWPQHFSGRLQTILGEESQSTNIMIFSTTEVNSRKENVLLETAKINPSEIIKISRLKPTSKFSLRKNLSLWSNNCSKNTFSCFFRKLLAFLFSSSLERSKYSLYSVIVIKLVLYTGPFNVYVKPLSANPAKCSNTLKQFVGCWGLLLCIPVHLLRFYHFWDYTRLTLI